MNTDLRIFMNGRATIKRRFLSELETHRAIPWHSTGIDVERHSTALFSVGSESLSIMHVI